MTYSNQEIAEQIVGILIRNQVTKDEKAIKECCEAAKRAFDRDTINWGVIARRYHRFYHLPD